MTPTLFNKNTPVTLQRFGDVDHPIFWRDGLPCANDGLSYITGVQSVCWWVFSTSISLHRLHHFLLLQTGLWTFLSELQTVGLLGIMHKLSFQPSTMTLMNVDNQVVSLLNDCDDGCIKFGPFETLHKNALFLYFYFSRI